MVAGGVKWSPFKKLATDKLLLGLRVSVKNMPAMIANNGFWRCYE